jgi:hypothetical protein
MGRDFHAQPDYSDEIAFQIDKEIRRIVDESYDRAEDLLVDNRALLDKLAADLIEYETVNAEHLKRLNEQYAVGPEVPQRAGSIALGKESDDKGRTQTEHLISSRTWKELLATLALLGGEEGSRYAPR